MTKTELLEALRQLPDDCSLVKNAVGNLAILDAQGLYLGYVDLQDGAVELLPVPGDIGASYPCL